MFGLAALEAGAAFAALVWVPREGPAISPARALLLAILLGFAVLCIVFAYRPPRWLEALPRRSVILLSALLALLIAVALFLLRFLDPPALAPFYERLGPLLWYLLIFALQICALLLSVKYGLHADRLQDRGFAVKPFAIALASLALIFVLVSFSRIGITPDAAYWGEPGVPLLGWQFALALLAGLVIALVGLGTVLPKHIDLLLGAGVWLLAVLVWLSIPTSVTRNSFYAPITPPANQPFPNSDAGYYDSMAESLLIGQPYQGQIPTRPLYILLLTGLHLAAGENYPLIIAGQTLVLALIPVLLYFLGRTLHSRAAGVIAALFAIFRESTTIMVSSQTRVSDSRTLLVDLPTLLLVLAACVASVRWLERREAKSALLAGGLFGLLLLLRTQSLLIAPVILLVAIISVGFRNRAWILPAGVFGAALVLTAVPWVAHNFLDSGHFTIDAPFQYQIIASQYQYTGNLDINNVDLQGKSVAALLLAFLARDPGFVLGFLSTHFLATEIDGLLALPLFHAYAGLTSPIDLYWLTWNGHLGLSNILLLLVYLIVIALGLATAWRRLRWAGLVPLVFSLTYALSNGVGRFSGWRYDLPADWIWYFYLAIGIAELLALAMLLFGADPMRLFTPRASASPGLMHAICVVPIALGFLLVGALPWIVEGIGLAKYVDQDPVHLAAVLAASPDVQASGLTESSIASFISSPSAVLQSGRILYPRFFSRNLGLASAHPWPAYAPRDFPRLGFLLLNQLRQDVVFPTRQLAGPFPQAADAIVLGCQRADYVEARLVYLPAFHAIYMNPPVDGPCE